MGSSGSKVVKDVVAKGTSTTMASATATVKRSLPTAPSTYIPPSSSAAESRAAASALPTPSIKTTSTEDKSFEPEQDELRDHKKVIDAFHQLNAAVDKRAIPSVGYAKGNEMLTILKKRQEVDRLNRLPDRARAQTQLNQGLHKASMPLIYTMITSRHDKVAHRDPEMAWTPEAAAHKLGWSHGGDAFEVAGVAAVQTLVRYVNTADPIMVAGGSSEMAIGVWTEPLGSVTVNE